LSSGEFLLYQTPDGQARMQLRVQDGAVWLSQKQLTDLYQVSIPTVNEHLRGLFRDGEIQAERTIRKFQIVAREATREVERQVEHHNLEAIRHVGAAPARAAKKKKGPAK
jgi:hypothetical protein